MHVFLAILNVAADIAEGTFLAVALLAMVMSGR